MTIDEFDEKYFASYSDALDFADNAGLLNAGEEVGTAGIYERAGLTGESRVDSAFNHHCQIEAGYSLMTADDSIYEV